MHWLTEKWEILHALRAYLRKWAGICVNIVNAKWETAPLDEMRNVRYNIRES